MSARRLTALISTVTKPSSVTSICTPLVTRLPRSSSSLVTSLRQFSSSPASSQPCRNHRAVASPLSSASSSSSSSSSSSCCSCCSSWSSSLHGGCRCATPLLASVPRRTWFGFPGQEKEQKEKEEKEAHQQQQPETKEEAKETQPQEVVEPKGEKKAEEKKAEEKKTEEKKVEEKKPAGGPGAAATGAKAGAGAGAGTGTGAAGTGNGVKVKTVEEQLRATVAEKEKLIADKTKEVADLKDRVLRAMAEQENTRQRAANDVKAANKFGNQGFAKSLLEAADTLEMASKEVAKEIEQYKDDESFTSHPAFQTLTRLFEGVVLTDKVLHKALVSNHVVKFESLGEKFDPNIHDGIFQMEDPTKTPGTVGVVLKAGYKLHDRVIRPATVGTIKASTPPTA